MIICSDVLEWCNAYDGPLFHAVICDPPYGLNESEVNVQEVLTAWLADQEYKPGTSGFMGRDWDAFLPGPAIWRAIRRHCYPGAFLFAFGGTRTADLLALALRLAGWEKRDEIDWVYASGFPKNHHIGRAIDRAAKAQRPIVGTRRHQPKFDAAGFDYRKKDNGFNSKDRDTFNVTAPASDLSRAWDGHGTALKPAHEPILVFRNPFSGTYAENCTQTGAGALWIDGGRIGTDDNLGGGTYGGIFGTGAPAPPEGHPAGRWPSNLLLCHDPRCEPIGTRRVRGTVQGTQRGNANFRGGARSDIDRDAGYADADGMETITAWRCVESCPVLALGRQSGESESKASQRGTFNGPFGGIDPSTTWQGQSTERGHDDSGTAARYFFQADYMYERLEAADPISYCAKADRAEREAGLDPRQIALLGMEEIEGQSHRSATPPDRRCRTCGGWYPTAMRRRPGSTCTCDEPDFAFVDFPEETINDGRQKSIDNPYQRGETTRRNLHPCIKPLSLCRYLATLLLPPALYAPRRLLVPFAGAASEYCGAVLAGWEEIVGIELEPDYCRIGEARAAYWTQRRHEFLDPSKPIEVKADAAPDGQLDMFMREL